MLPGAGAWHLARCRAGLTSRLKDSGTWAVRNQQDAMVGTESDALPQPQATAIFNDAQTRVNQQIGGLSNTAMNMWNEGVSRYC
jgi:hypothetical protein